MADFSPKADMDNRAITGLMAVSIFADKHISCFTTDYRRSSQRHGLGAVQDRAVLLQYGLGFVAVKFSYSVIGSWNCFICRRPAIGTSYTLNMHCGEFPRGLVQL